MDPLIRVYNYLTSPRARKVILLIDEHFKLHAVKVPLLKHLVYLRSYDQIIEDLKESIHKLKKTRYAILHKVKEEEEHGNKEIDKKVKDWVEGANAIISEYQRFTHDVEVPHDLATYDLRTSGYLPKTGIRTRLGEEALDITRKVEDLSEKANHDSFSYWLGPPDVAEYFDNIDFECFPSRVETMENIKKALKSPDVRIIGLCGPSGVGKTTLAKEIARQALEGSEEGKIFDVVVKANVTRYPDIRKIQGQIAYSLGLKLDEESDIVRAARIQKRLKNMIESTLIILDDIWAELDLSILGVPFPLASADDSWEEGRSKASYKGCKVLLISKSRQVLSSQVEWKAIYFVDVLREKEAEMLFKKIAGIDRKSEVVKLATLIASKCNGCMVLIVTTARALKDCRHLLWEDVLRQLERGKLTVASEFSTILSYGLLDNEELKDVFLLCARMGPDTLIMDLVKYCIGLGFLQEVYGVKETRDRVYALVGKLKLSGLLYDSYSSDHFTMSDIVRSAALSIASKEKHVFTMTKGKVDDWPDVDNLVMYEAISLHHCDIIDGFPSHINFRKLRLFHVNNSDPRLVIPDKLFKGMKELKVLILTGFNLSPLPSSIGCLTKLRMLCLEYCKLGEGLSIIGKFKKLRVLSLSGSDIEKLPVELKHLTKLQLLDISNCSKLEKIPSNVISSLISLEELCMRNTFIQWEFEGQTNQSEKASLSELGHLNQLTNLDIQIPNASLLPKNMFFDKLSSYKIVIGDLNADTVMDFKMPGKYEASKYLAIQLKEGFDVHSRKGVKMLFDTVEHLFLEDLDGVDDLFYSLNLKGFPHLKHLLIAYNSNIQYLIGSKERRHFEKVFPRLESLHLYNLKDLHNMCSFELSAPSFGYLKLIKINLCDKLKQVFLFSMISLLTVLESIEVSECNALEKIVTLEGESNTNETGLVKFPELCSLTLLSLPKLIGFYPIQLIGREATELFHEKVEVPKLERMVLSSLQVDKIWGRQSSLRPCFQNLIHLDVNGCWNLTYLISIAMARNLVNLQSLFVSECDKMRRIFVDDKAWSHSVPEDSIFPNLKTMKLSCLKSLNEIWNPGFFSNSFGKLDTLIVEECYMLVNVFACYMEAIFHSLCNLRVTNCNSMRAVFVLRGQRYGRSSTNLQDVCLETLPNLEHIWRNDRNDIKLNNLQNMVVHDCRKLKYIFPFSKAKSLDKLEYLKIAGCFQLREIVKNVSSRGQPLEFHNLTTIKFSILPRLAWFYRGQNKLSCPALNHLSIELCDNLDLFRNELTVAPTLFSKEVINELKSMQIDSSHAQSLSHYTINLEEFGLSRLASPEIIYYFLHRSPNLKSLSLNNCSITEIVPFQIPPELEKLGVVSKLKRLKLIDLPRLEIIGFDRDTILQRIEFLILWYCPCLVNMVSSSVSLTHLTILEVVSCDGLKTLVPQLVAKSLVQLKTMKVIKCQSMVEIVESREENAREVVIIFRQLKVLELVSLEKLNCFSKGSVFEFPSLEKLVVSACPKMEIFCKEVNSAPFLQKVFLEHEKENIWCWRQDLNTTIQEIFLEKKFFEVVDEISLSEHHDLQKLWRNGAGGLRNSWFYNLKTLRLEDCESLLCAIPYNIFLCLKSLKELEVRNCNKVEVIFEKANDNGEIQPQLRSLTLVGLSKLKHVWEKGNIMFQNLLHVSVSDCEVLDTLFLVAIAKNIKKLEKLEINSCQNLLEIVKKEDVTEDVAEQFVFPCLTLLCLYDLPKLIYFYCEKFTVKCPELRILEVLACPKFELFQSERLEREGEGSGTSIYIQPLFTNLQDIYFLEKLAVDWIHSSVLSSSLQLNKDLRLKCLNEIRLYFDVDDNENPTVPSEILDKAPYLQHMTVGRCKSLERFQTLNLKIREQLKTLALHRVSELKFICLNIVLKKLYCLDVVSCPHLIKLFDSRSAVSFSALTVLHINGCLGLEYLFTSSVAKVLIHLQEIMVMESGSIKEIVKVDQDGITCQELEFMHLHTISLYSLSSLEYFYSGNDTLKLPALAIVGIQKCPKMKTFSRGHINAESFRVIYNSFQQNDESFFHKGLNGSVKVLFLLQMLSKGMDGTEFSKHSELRHAWKDGLSIQSNWMYSLKTLKLVNCDIEQYAIPSKLFPCLKSLKTLEVRSCKKVENIFANNDTEAIPSQLSTLILEDLSELTLVWEKNFLGILGFQNLKHVRVTGCKSIQTLFPAVLAENLKMLETLEVGFCDKLEGIFRKEEDEATGLEKRFSFPQLTLLGFEKLLEFTYFFPELFTVDCPKLNYFAVLDCPKFEVFHGAHPEGKTESISTSISRQPLIPNFNMLSKGMDGTEFSKHSNLRDAWKDGLSIQKDQNNWMYTVKTLKLVNCDIEPYAIPSYILPCFKSLEILEVRSCNRVKKIFGKNDTEAILCQLSTLILEDLSELTHVWENFQGILQFQNLKQASVIGCKSIQTLFPTVLAKNLKRLEKLEVKSCDELREIVGKEEVATGSEKKFLFPRLTSLDLNKLQELTCFYPGIFTVECPKLDHFSVLGCPKLELFQGAHPEGEPESISASNNRQPFILNWCFCNLISLVVEGCEFLADALLPSHVLPFLSNLKTLEVRNCNSIEAIFVNTKVGPQGSLGLPFLEKLCVENCKNLLEIVAKEEIATNEANEVITVFPRITILKLLNLHNLRCIYPEVHILEWPMMQVLDVTHCPQLDFFTTEFQSSRDLHSECQDSFPTTQQAIVSLEKVTPCMEVLSLGKEEAQMIEEGNLRVDLQELKSVILQCFHDETVEFPFVFCSKAPLPSFRKLVVRHSAFKEIFPSQTSDIDCTKILSQLGELELRSLFQLKSIGFGHSWMGPFLENLKTLLVWNCGGLKNLTPSTVSFSSLIKLHVKNCRGLKYLFTFSTAKTLCALEELCIGNCKSLKAIVVKEGDECNYDIEDESEGEDGGDNENESETEYDNGDTSEDEGEDENDEGQDDAEEGDKSEGDGEDESVDEDEGEVKDRIIFKKLKILKLSTLPKLGIFYSGSSTLKFPSLKQMLFTQCHNMKIFRLGDKVSKDLQVTIDGECPEGDINNVIMQQDEGESQPADLVSLICDRFT